jgi:hypothetical protein
MTLLNSLSSSGNIDIADLLSLLRDIGDRLDGIQARLDGTEERHDEITGMMAAMAAAEPGHERAVRMAAEAVLADLAARQSLITGDGEYCASCLLKENGYPQLAQLLAGARPDGEHE